MKGYQNGDYDSLWELWVRGGIGYVDGVFFGSIKMRNQLGYRVNIWGGPCDHFSRNEALDIPL